MTPKLYSSKVKSIFFSNWNIHNVIRTKNKSFILFFYPRDVHPHDRHPSPVMVVRRAPVEHVFFDITSTFQEKSHNKNLYYDFRNLLSKYGHVVPLQTTFVFDKYVITLLRNDHHIL